MARAGRYLARPVKSITVIPLKAAAMPDAPLFDLWLEFEHATPSPDDDPTDDFANIQVRLRDGRKYAMNVWTFRFLHRARFPWPYEDTSGQPAEYVVAPDLFVERLDRPTLERVVTQLLATGGLDEQWLCEQWLCPADETAG